MKSIFIFSIFVMGLFAINNYHILSPIKNGPVTQSIEKDSLIEKNKHTLKSVEKINCFTDSLTRAELQNISNERDDYKRKLKIGLLKSLRMIEKRDTVFIEVEKNFWGRKKIKIKNVSDSTINDYQDNISFIIEDSTNY